jgi:hypothetical protein
MRRELRRSHTRRAVPCDPLGRQTGCGVRKSKPNVAVDRGAAWVVGGASMPGRPQRRRRSPWRRPCAVRAGVVISRLVIAGVSELSRQRCRIDRERPHERCPALRGQQKVTPFRNSPHPVLLEPARSERRTERAREMRPSLRPVKTFPGERPSLLPGLLHIHPELLEEHSPGRRHTKVADGRPEISTSQHGFGNRNAKPAGEMVVAGSRKADVVDGRLDFERVRNCLGRQGSQGLESLGDRGARKPIVPAPTAGLTSQE